MRTSCIKPSHGRRVDLVMMNPLVEQLMPRNANQQDLVQGTDYRALPDDQSLLIASSPLLKGRDCFLYLYPIFRWDLYHVNIVGNGTMECDDHHLKPGFESAGTWVYYIR